MARRDRQHRIGWAIAAVFLVTAAVYFVARESTPIDSRPPSASRSGGNTITVRRDLPVLNGKRHAAPQVQLRGTVRTKDGSPLAFATVCASCTHCDLTLQPPHCVLTDARGGYVLEGLARGAYRITSAAQGFSPSAANGGRAIVIDEGAASRSDLDSEMAPGGALVSGIVRDVAGGAIAGATVHALFPLSPPPHFDVVAQPVTSDGDGRFALTVRAGPINLVAAADGYAGARLEAVAPNMGVEIVLSPPGRIAGVVATAGEGQPVANVAVHAVNRAHVGATATSDAAGAFEIKSLAPGLYEVRASGSGWSGSHPETVVLDMLGTVEGLVVPVVAAVRVRAALRLPDNTPCLDGHVRLVADANATLLTAETDQHGYASFEAVRPDLYRVAMACVGYGDQEGPTLRVGERDMLDVVFALSAKLDISVRVIDQLDRPVENLHVQAVRRDSGADPRQPPLDARTGRTAADGSFRFVGLSSGSYQISAEQSADSPTVELSGENSPASVVLKIQAGGRLVVRIASAEGAPTERLIVNALSTDASRHLIAEPLGAGQYLFGYVAPGDYEVWARDGTNPRARVGGAGAVVSVKPHATTEASLIYGGYRGRIGGQVVDSSGQGIDGVWVQAVPADFESDPFFGRAQMQRVEEGSRALSDPGGYFEIGGLAENGSFSVLAERALGGGQLVQGVQPGTKNLIIALEPVGRLAGRVVDPSRQPVARFALAVRNAATRQELNLNFVDGQWRIDAVTPGTLQLVARDTTGTLVGTLTMQLAPGGVVEDLEIVLQPAPTSSGG